VKHKHAFCVLVTGLVWMVAAAAAQETQRAGVPQDWSHQHIVFSRSGLAQSPGLIYSEPRVLHHLAQRSQPLNATLFRGPNMEGPTANDPMHGDWNVALNGRVAANMFPAKYSFDAGAPPSCANDYVVYGLNVAGTATHANLVAFNNIYSGTSPTGICGAAPTTMFAYNITTITSGRILNSPALSVDGKKIAFVESGSTTAIFHVLTWATGAGNGTIAAPAKPGVGNTATMTSLTFAAALDTRSSPWIDYNTDTAYVGADDGRIYKIHPVFGVGTPALAGAPWPVTVSANVRPTGPVLDHSRGVVMVGSQNGVLYQINATTGAVKSLVVGRSGGTNPGILASPIVDVSNGTTFVVSANDNVSGVLVQVDTASMTQLAKARLGIASKSGTNVTLYEPAFDNNYFNSPSTGKVHLCGTGAADITPYQYEFGFTGTTLNTTPSFSQQLVNSTNARCSGWTEFFNPNIGAGGTDFFFFGLTTDCTGTGTSGCVISRPGNNASPLVKRNVTGGPSGIVTDGYSTAAQASSIYFTGAAAPNTAYKMTQSTLQ
jgi:hypothetical protein